MASRARVRDGPSGGSPGSHRSVMVAAPIAMLVLHKDSPWLVSIRTSSVLLPPRSNDRTRRSAPGSPPKTPLAERNASASSERISDAGRSLPGFFEEFCGIPGAADDSRGPAGDASPGDSAREGKFCQDSDTFDNAGFLEGFIFGKIPGKAGDSPAPAAEAPPGFPTSTMSSRMVCEPTSMEANLEFPGTSSKVRLLFLS